jgi:DNA polymerase-3 subunit beta
MKFYCLQENLKNGLQAVAHVAGKNINLPILNNIMLVAGKNDIKIIATDLEIGIVNKIRGKVEKEGSFTVDSKLFNDYVAFLPNKKVDINYKDNNLHIICDNSQTKIKGLESDEFPLIPQIDKNNLFKICLTEFKKGLTQTIFAASLNDARIELTGILFNFYQGKLSLAATDSFRLAEKNILIANNNISEISVIIPAKAAQELLRICSIVKETIEKQQEIEIYITENQAMFVVDSVELTTRIIDGQFPDYKQIIPTKTKTKAIINKNDFIRAVKMSSLFSKKGINDINLDFPVDKNKVIISSSSAISGENFSEIEASVQGIDNAVVINFKYLLEGLNNIDSEFVVINMVDGNTPCLLSADKQEDYFYIIMPIKQ